MRRVVIEFDHSAGSAGEAGRGSGALAGRAQALELAVAALPRQGKRRLRQTAGYIAGAIVAALAGGPAGAQTVLPGIVVEGATLAKPRAQPTPRPATAASTPAAAGEPDTAPSVATEVPIAAAAAAAGNADLRGFAAESIGTSVSVVTGAELADQQVRHAGDALRSLPGVAVSRSGSVASQTQVRIRGAEGNHTLVLIDGIVANQPGTGEFDFSNLPADQIERIEVIRGAQSSLYGSGAIGGVVNVVTKGGRGPLTTSVWSEMGSFKTVESGASVSGGSDRA
ncbi:MAG: TonB-dependent receptor, partial [Hyphomicrobiaceae bacterium]